MKIIKSIEEAQEMIEMFEGEPENFNLSISEELQDPMGLNIAIITDCILKKGWLPDGFEQNEGYRIYKYVGA